MNQTYCPCPKCSTLRTKVVCTRRTSDKIIIRRRKCIVCEHRWYSIQYPEVPVANQEIKWIAAGRNAKFIQSA
jgi:transcriptional regulator NrdR family protein